MDVCGCCEMCANDVGQLCGGLWGLEGTCGDRLECVKLPKHKKKEYFWTGICQKTRKKIRLDCVYFCAEISESLYSFKIPCLSCKYIT